jgi:hypothetical protein
MSSGSIGFRRTRLMMAALALGAALVCGPAPASASEARSSPDDLRRFVSVARSLEQAPLSQGARADREWALEWLTEAPDVTVTLCADALGGMLPDDYPYAGEILLQDAFSMAAFAIEHPETANDPNARQLAGVEGALTAYRSILRDKPEARTPILENLVRTQSRGELPDFVRKMWIRCSAEK